MHCIICGKQLTGRQRKFCCRKCNSKSFTLKRGFLRTRGNCSVCGKELVGKQTLYCSGTCKAKRCRPRHPAVCKVCGSSFDGWRSGQTACSDKCAKALRKKYLDIPACLAGANRKLDKNLGYVRVYAPMHPEANTWGYVYEHRVVAEQMLGRRLLPGEVVHHKNGIRHDNREDNLEVMSASEHAKIPSVLK